MKRLFASFFTFGILVSFAAQPFAFAGPACCALKSQPTTNTTPHVEVVDVTQDPSHVEHFTDSEG